MRLTWSDTRSLERFLEDYRSGDANIETLENIVEEILTLHVGGTL